jgi:threonine dehydrogenase-like Zn-dependent dehydrogenase
VAYFAKVRGVKRVIAIDSVKYRLDVARDKIGCEVIDAGTQDVVKTIQELVPGGPNKCVRSRAADVWLPTAVFLLQGGIAGPARILAGEAISRRSTCHYEPEMHPSLPLQVH